MNRYMDNLPQTEITLLTKWILVAFWAVVGGVIHTIRKAREGQTKGLLDGIMLAIISGFAGAMWGLLAVKFFDGDTVAVSVASGMGGYASVEGLRTLTSIFNNTKFKSTLLEVLVKILK